MKIVVKFTIRKKEKKRLSYMVNHMYQWRRSQKQSKIFYLSSASLIIDSSFPMDWKQKHKSVNSQIITFAENPCHAPFQKQQQQQQNTQTRTLFIRSLVIATMHDTTFLACDLFLQAYSVPRQYHHVKAHFHMINTIGQKTNLTKIVALLKIIAPY